MTTQQLLAYYVNAGNAHNLQRDYESALQSCQLALALAPEIPEAWYNLGIAEAGLGNRNKALQALEKSRIHSLKSADAQNSIGAKFLELDAAAEAEKCLLLAISLMPEHALAHSNLGKLRQQQGRPEEAERHLRQAIQFQPQLAILYVNLGSTLHEKEAYGQAEAALRQAVKLDPHLAPGWKNLAVALTSLQRDEEALACYEQLIRLSPDDADAQWGLALLQIKHQHYQAGWENFEARWRVRDLGLKPLASTQPRWTGQKTDAPLLLWAEQGIGDQVLFGSILPDVANFPQRKLVAIDRRLIPIFQRSMPQFEFMDINQLPDRLEFKTQLPLGSLPRYFRSSSEAFRAVRHPYLLADASRAGQLRKKIARSGKLVCGISWSSTRKQLGKHKSIRLEQLLAPLDSNQLHFVNLQYGDTSEERQALTSTHGIEVQSIDEIDCFTDLDSLTSLIEACDIVVSISNSTAHLAGALGKPTMLLLPWSEGRLWYWANHDGNNPWYPSITMFPQENPGVWQEPLERLQAHLAKFRADLPADE